MGKEVSEKLDILDSELQKSNFPDPAVFGHGWKLVRHKIDDGLPFQSKDDFEGTESYGNPDTNQLSSNNWSIKFADMKFDQFLFASWDYKIRVIVARNSRFFSGNYVNWEQRYKDKTGCSWPIGGGINVFIRDSSEFVDTKWILARKKKWVPVNVIRAFGLSPHNDEIVMTFEEDRKEETAMPIEPEEEIKMLRRSLKVAEDKVEWFEREIFSKDSENNKMKFELKRKEVELEKLTADLKIELKRKEDEIEKLKIELKRNLNADLEIELKREKDEMKFELKRKENELRETAEFINRLKVEFDEKIEQFKIDSDRWYDMANQIIN